MRVMNVIPSAAGESALAPAGNNKTGILDSLVFNPIDDSIYAVCAHREGYSSFFIKLNENGEIIWRKDFQDTVTNRMRDITLDSSGTIYLKDNFIEDTGSSLTEENIISRLLKYDPNGNLIWEQNINASEIQLSKNDELYTIFSISPIFDYQAIEKLFLINNLFHRLKLTLLI